MRSVILAVLALICLSGSALAQLPDRFGPPAGEVTVRQHTGCTARWGEEYHRTEYLWAAPPDASRYDLELYVCRGAQVVLWVHVPAGRGSIVLSDHGYTDAPRVASSCAARLMLYVRDTGARVEWPITEATVTADTWLPPPDGSVWMWIDGEGWVLYQVPRGVELVRLAPE